MSTAVVVHESQPGTALTTPTARAVTLLRPIAAPAAVVEAQEETRAMVAAALKEGRDYGKIPGTDKNALLKPGAERVALGFGCFYGEPEILEQEIEHDRVVEWRKRWKNKKTGEWEEERGEALGLYRYVVRVPVILRETGAVVGTGVGSCSTMESKYMRAPRDAENTVLKMAHKRAMVAACLITFGLSDQFTQDEDVVEAMRAAAGEDGGGTRGASSEPEAKCPKCGGRMWDNRAKKSNPKAPDFKCRDKDCDGVFWPGQWPPKVADAAPAAAAVATARPVTFPDRFPIKDLRGRAIAETPTADLARACSALRDVEHPAAEKWAGILTEVLEERRVAGDASPTPLPDPVTATADQVAGAVKGGRTRTRKEPDVPQPVTHGADGAPF